MTNMKIEKEDYEFVRESNANKIQQSLEMIKESSSL